jgi:zinc D-Ala-D-Ala carboxypeptidase
MGPFRSSRGLVVAVAAIAVIGVIAPSAAAYRFERKLRPGMHGRDVRALQLRVAGWYPTSHQNRFYLDGDYGTQTADAVKAFQKHYGMKATGVAYRRVFKKLNRLADPNKSTLHFAWSEFRQHRNPSCSAQANAYAGSFSGGMTSRRRVKKNVKRLMWRLEAIRAKGGAKPIGINSGFRSVPYNNCIGGASGSQHLYGTAADNRMANVSNRRERHLAKSSQVHGIMCYAAQSHNHFDLRIENKAAPNQHFWWWPKRDSQGRDLSDDGAPCWGQRGTRSAPSRSMPSPDQSFVPSREEVEAFENAGEPADLGGSD